MDYLKFSSKPSNKHEGKHHIIIVGAGIIGVCTAYYLTIHPKFDPAKHHITIIESKRVAGGASGKAGGLLALWAFPQQIVPLSFQLHQELSNKYNGEEEWGYRRLTTVSLEGDLTGVPDDLTDSSSEDEEEDDDEDDEEEDDDNNQKRDGNNLLNGESKELNNISQIDGSNIISNINKKINEISSNSFNINLTKNNDIDESLTKNGCNTNLNNANYNQYYSNKDEHSTGNSINSTKNDDRSGEINLKESNTTRDSPECPDSDSSHEKPPKKAARRNRSHRKRKQSLPDDLNWINSSLIDSCSSLGGADTTAQVLPYKFTNFMLKKAVEYSRGSIELILGKVEEIKYSMETGQATGVIFKPTSAKSESDDRIELFGDQIVLAIGPWTSKILPDCPISGLRAHSITVAPFKDQPVSPYAIFTELKTGPTSYISPEIYARHDEVYVCGEGDSAVDVPETTDDVEVVKSNCDELFKQVGKISPNLRKGHILKRQACYLPVLDVPSSSGPLIGETNVENLYLCSGHSCWGINNAPGTGKMMSELLFDGECISADISALDPSLYFDASVLVGDDYDYESSETMDSDSSWTK